MKNFAFILAFLFVGTGYSQNRDTDRRENRSNRGERSNFYEIVDTTRYTLDKKKYLFTPDEKGIKISRVDESGGEINISDLRRTTMDGFYIMTSTATDEVSFGKFDRQGNFRTYKYDRENDTVIEENFKIQDPVQRRDRNRRNERGRNQDRRNSRNNNQ